MKNASFRQKLLTSFLAIGILPLLICTLLMLNIFRLSLTRSAADAAETQLDAMSGELSGLLSDCETVMEKLCAEPAVAAALDRSELDEGVWLSREEIPMEENPASLTHTMIQLFRQGKDPQ